MPASPQRPLVLVGNVCSALRKVPHGSVQTVVTSPPYHGALRDYEGPSVDWPEIGYSTLGGALTVPEMTCQLGHEPSVDAYVGHLVYVARLLRRTLRTDGTFWLNLGDTYAGRNPPDLTDLTVKAKDLCGVPWSVAFALRADGWYLRDAVVWAKPNPMPGGVSDRCLPSYEMLFLLTPTPEYHFDTFAVREAVAHNDTGRAKRNVWWVDTDSAPNVWEVVPRGYKGAHFATFPQKLVEPCLAATGAVGGVCPKCATPLTRVVSKERVSTRPGTSTKRTGNPEVDGHRDPGRHVTKMTHAGWTAGCGCNAIKGALTTRTSLVLDPFVGSGTTLEVAKAKGMRAVGIEVNPEYVPLIRKRCGGLITEERV